MADGMQASTERVWRRAGKMAAGRRHNTTGTLPRPAPLSSLTDSDAL